MAGSKCFILSCSSLGNTRCLGNQLHLTDLSPGDGGGRLMCCYIGMVVNSNPCFEEKCWSLLFSCLLGCPEEHARREVSGREWRKDRSNGKRRHTPPSFLLVFALFLF